MFKKFLKQLFCIHDDYLEPQDEHSFHYKCSRCGFDLLREDN